MQAQMGNSLRIALSELSSRLGFSGEPPPPPPLPPQSKSRSKRTQGGRRRRRRSRLDEIRQVQSEHGGERKKKKRRPRDEPEKSGERRRRRRRRPEEEGVEKAEGREVPQGAEQATTSAGYKPTTLPTLYKMFKKPKREGATQPSRKYRKDFLRNRSWCMGMDEERLGETFVSETSDSGSAD
ncbi:serine/arginine repetitive matrix protein 3 [Nematostella vectensis]|uniref:serine/arginine repetitive matrix protein 3 n=1 Tax=Nematostella vectensis TaxID=45351 RepID=UPI0013903923|nr:serine/arginine repetitive matrix protein 3 [Nematostella vectensis]